MALQRVLIGFLVVSLLSACKAVTENPGIQDDEAPTPSEQVGSNNPPPNPPPENDNQQPPEPPTNDEPAGSDLVNVKLTWDPPEYNIDGTKALDLYSFKIYYGEQSGMYTSTIDLMSDVGQNSLSHTIPNLRRNQGYYFCVSAYNIALEESSCSQEIFIQL